MGIAVTGGNISNADTKGYTLQRVVQDSTSGASVLGFAAQIGVKAAALERSYDTFIQSQIIGQQQNSGYSSALLYGLQTIENMIDETNGSGISEAMSDFWASWERLSENPNGTVERRLLILTAENVATAFNNYQQNLQTISRDLNGNITTTIDQVNRLSAEIAHINDQLYGINSSKTGEQNLLLDKRDEAAKTLANLINANTVIDESGYMNVFLGNGVSLVQGVWGHTLTVQIDSVNNEVNIYSTSFPGETVNDGITKGELGAYLDLKTEIIPEYARMMDEVALAFAERVNEVHASGYDHYGNVGTEFYTLGDPTRAASTIKLNSVVAEDGKRIAASGSVNGDGNLASRMADIQNERLMHGGTATLNSGLAAIVGHMGQQVLLATQDNDRQAIAANHLFNQRESVSGVSIDEELIRLMKFQMGYSAAGKLASTADEMFQTLLSIGR